VDATHLLKGCGIQKDWFIRFTQKHMANTQLVIALWLSAAVVSTNSARGQAQKLTASDAVEFDKFGWSVDLDESRLIVGAPAKNVFGGNSGAAYIFRHNGSEWEEEARLTAGDQLAYNEFGYAVSVDGDFAAVGARVNYTGMGAVYIYKRNGDVWEEEVKIECPDCSNLQAQALFGRSVALQGDRVLVGAQQSGSSLYEAGIVYSFRRGDESWVLEKTFIPDDAVITAQFGWSVSLSAPYAIMGAPFDPISFNNPMGAAYIYKLDENEWVFDSKLLPDVVATSQLFGFSVGIDGDVAVVGSPGGSDTYGKRASVFENEGGLWIRRTILFSSDGNTNYGRSVGLANDQIVVGNTRYGAYVFEKNGSEWDFLSKAEPEDLTYTANEFGESVAMSRRFFAVGDPSGVDEGGLKTGAVHVYARAAAVGREEGWALPAERYALSRNYPNPFSRNTTISWAAPLGGWQSLKVVDVWGREVATLVDGYRTAGEQAVEFDAAELPVGLYLYRLQAEGVLETGKMLLIRH
jgi:hypothetical protein